jgi:hypothetical protein
MEIPYVKKKEERSASQPAFILAISAEELPAKALIT